MEQVRRIEDLTKEELIKRIQAIDPLCVWGRPWLVTKKEEYMRHQWAELVRMKNRLL